MGLAHLFSLFSQIVSKNLGAAKFINYSMEDRKFRKENIFSYFVYILVAAGAFMIIRYFVKPKPVDTESNKNISLFIQNAIDEIDQKIKKRSKNEDIATWLSWNKSNAALYDEAKANKDNAVKEKSKKLKDLILKVQERDFPDLRDKFVEAKKEVLAKENIQISASGDTKNTLIFTGDLFEPRRFRKNFLKGINQNIKDLRFKKVTFKWSGDKEGTADYKIKSKDDSDI